MCLTWNQWFYSLFGLGDSWKLFLPWFDWFGNLAMVNRTTKSPTVYSCVVRSDDDLHGHMADGVEIAVCEFCSFGPWHICVLLGWHQLDVFVKLQLELKVNISFVISYRR